MRAGDLAMFGIDAGMRSAAPVSSPSPVALRARVLQRRATRAAFAEVRRRLDRAVHAQRERMLLAELALVVAQADATFRAAQRIFAEVDSR